MKLERTKNTKRNMTFGLLLKLYQIVAPFLMRTVMIFAMGVQYLGLNSLFTSILHILNLAELGVGSAMVFSMYKPIAQEDERTICALMRLYRRYYRIIGLVIGAVGVALTPVIPHLVSGTIPAELDMRILYLLNLGATVLTYWLFAYKNCLLQAYQRTNVSSIITVITNTLQYALQLVALLVWKNYYLYVIMAMLTQVVNNIMTAVVTTRLYPRYKPVGRLLREETRQINRRITDLFACKLGGVVLSSSDTIVISYFLGLTVLAIYQNYFFILTSIIALVEIIFTSMIAGLGNSFVTETKEKNYADFEKFTFIFLGLICVCTCCFLGLYQPFMEMWLGKGLMLNFEAVVCFATYFYVYTLNRLLSVYKDAAGLWHEDRFRPLLVAVLNLTLNILLVQWRGIVGVVLATVISQVILGMPWLLHNMFKLFFGLDKLKKYLLQLLSYTSATILAGTLTCALCWHIDIQPWVMLLACIPISVGVPTVMYFLLFRRYRQFAPAVRFLDRLTGEKLRLTRLLPRK